MENGQKKENIDECLEKEPIIERQENENNLYRDTLTISFLKGFSEKFKRIT